MLIEAQYNFPTAYVGGTFDGQVTLQQLTALQTFIGPWQSGTTYLAGQAVTAADGQTYVASSTTQGSNPVTDGNVHWALAAFYNLSGYSASLVIVGGFTLTSGAGLTLGGAAGTIVIKATPTQTGTITSPRALHYYLQLTSGAGDVYFPIGGSITFASP